MADPSTLLALAGLKLPERSSSLATFGDSQDGTQLAKRIRQTEDYVANAKGFRWQSPGHIQNQDRTLREYRRIATCVAVEQAIPGLQIEEGMADDVNDSIIFPEDRDAQVNLICCYLKIAADEIKPRNATDSHPRVTALINRRQHMLYWAAQLRSSTAQPLDRMKILNRTKELIEKLGRDGLFNLSPRERVFLGRHDCLYLIDKDTTEAMGSSRRRLEYASQHHLLWCFGLICGVRPGSLVTSNDRPDHFLAWKDVKLQRIIANGAPTGHLLASVTFRWLKGNRDEVKKRQRTLTLHIRSPRDEQYLPLSIPHRLLSMAISRMLLPEHDSVASALNGKEVQFSIRPGARDSPVFVAETDIFKFDANEIQPMSAKQLAAYLRKCTLENGFQPRCTFYGFRALLATTVERKRGVDESQKVINHKHGTQTFYENYDQGLDNLDVTDLILEDGAGDFVSDSIDTGTYVPPVITRAEVPRNANKDAVTAFLNNHAELRALRGHPSYASKRQALRQRALQALLAAQWESNLHTVSAAEINQRKKDTALSTVLEELKRSMATGQSLDARIPADCVPSLAQHPQMTEDDTSISVDTDDDSNQSLGLNSAVPLAQAWMEMLVLGSKSVPLPLAERSRRAAEYHNRYNTDSKHCGLCSEDDTVPQTMKDEEYASLASLSRHISSFFHCGLGKFCRKMESELDQSPQRTLACPYGCELSFLAVDELVTHLIADGQLEAHDAAMRMDGWGCDTFFQYVSEMGPSLASQKKRKREQRQVSGPMQPLVRFAVEQPKAMRDPSVHRYLTNTNSIDNSPLRSLTRFRALTTAPCTLLKGRVGVKGN